MHIGGLSRAGAHLANNDPYVSGWWNFGSHCSLTRQVCLTNCNYEHDQARKKAAGADSSDLRPIWLRR